MILMINTDLTIKLLDYKLLMFSFAATWCQTTKLTNKIKEIFFFFLKSELSLFDKFVKVNLPTFFF